MHRADNTTQDIGPAVRERAQDAKLVVAGTADQARARAQEARERAREARERAQEARERAQEAQQAVKTILAETAAETIGQTRARAHEARDRAHEVQESAKETLAGTADDARRRAHETRVALAEGAQQARAQSRKRAHEARDRAHDVQHSATETAEQAVARAHDLLLRAESATPDPVVDRTRRVAGVVRRNPGPVLGVSAALVAVIVAITWWRRRTRPAQVWVEEEPPALPGAASYSADGADPRLPESVGGSGREHGR